MRLLSNIPLLQLQDRFFSWGKIIFTHLSNHHSAVIISCSTIRLSYIHKVFIFSPPEASIISVEFAFRAITCSCTSHYLLPSRGLLNSFQSRMASHNIPKDLAKYNHVKEVYCYGGSRDRHNRMSRKSP